MEITLYHVFSFFFRRTSNPYVQSQCSLHQWATVQMYFGDYTSWQKSHSKCNFHVFETLIFMILNKKEKINLKARNFDQGG